VRYCTRLLPVELPCPPAARHRRYWSAGTAGPPAAREASALRTKQWRLSLSRAASCTTASGWMDPVGVASWQLGRRRWECGVPPGLRLRADRSHSTAVQFVLLNQWTRLVSSSSHLFWFGFSAVTRIFSQLVLGNPTIYWHTLILQPSKGLFGYSYPMWIE
jgi:hypothetical protein